MDRDPTGLPARLPASAWGLTFGLTLPVAFLVFSVIHPYADSRPCVGPLADPFFDLVPHAHGWLFVARDLFHAVLSLAGAAVVWQAWKGDHRPVLRWQLGVLLLEMQRSVTIALTPICREGVTPGLPAVSSIPRLDLGFFSIPWEPIAVNDLVFSGHVGSVLLLSWATRASWPIAARAALWLFQAAQIYALLATREHYSIDIVLALPCAWLANAGAVRLLGALARRRRARGPG